MNDDFDQDDITAMRRNGDLFAFLRTRIVPADQRAQHIENTRQNRYGAPQQPPETPTA
ncbi:hypothetical protein [Streptomyces sp. bgisy091]|uniref:hypothetical protein n=1 Tax=Streptomyces sp. bgisy091 TaxID=3413778 RepID=UPI003D730574